LAMSKARSVAAVIIDEFEQLLADHDIVIPYEDREGEPEEACIYGEEYYNLEDSITAIICEEFGLVDDTYE